MKAIALLLVIATAAYAAPSKEAESDSLEVAHCELQRLTDLDTQKQYERYVGEFWFYESTSDTTNFAGVAAAEFLGTHGALGRPSIPVPIGAR